MRQAGRHAHRMRRGQTTAEYAILIGVVVGAIVAMQVYVRRGTNARIKTISDNKAEEFWNQLGRPPILDANGNKLPLPTQYEPYYASSTYDNTQDATRTESTTSGGVVKITGMQETSTRSGNQTTGKAQ